MIDQRAVKRAERGYRDDSSMIVPPLGQQPEVLASLMPGESGVVCALSRGHRAGIRLLALGFTPGAEVKMIQNLGIGPVIVLVRDTRVALGRGEASKIFTIVKERGDA